MGRGLSRRVGRIGHNNGPTLQPGTAWRRHCWTEARAALLPKLPIEIIRQRVRRAAEIGLDYKTYAGVRATTGHDIVAFLFSTNALRLHLEGRRIAAQKADKIRALAALRLLAVQPPLDPEHLARMLAADGVRIDVAHRAPGLADNWPATRDRLAAMIRVAGAPRAGTVVVGETALERDWVAAARLGAFVAGDRFFPPPG